MENNENKKSLTIEDIEIMTEQLKIYMDYIEQKNAEVLRFIDNVLYRLDGEKSNDA